MPTGASRTTASAASTSTGGKVTAAGVRRGNGLATCSLLRLLAYNLLEMLRSVHLRSQEAREAPWQQLRDWVRDALLWAAPDDQSSGEASPATP